MEIFYAKKAAEELTDLSREIQKRIAKKMRFYATQRDPLKFAKRLTDCRDGEFRFRIGKYRVLFDVKKETIFVLKIDNRDKSYD